MRTRIRRYKIVLQSTHKYELTCVSVQGEEEQEKDEASFPLTVINEIRRN